MPPQQQKANQHQKQKAPDIDPGHRQLEGLDIGPQVPAHQSHQQKILKHPKLPEPEQGGKAGDLSRLMKDHGKHPTRKPHRKQQKPDMMPHRLTMPGGTGGQHPPTAKSGKVEAVHHEEKPIHRSKQYERPLPRKQGVANREAGKLPSPHPGRRVGRQGGGNPCEGKGSQQQKKQEAGKVHPYPPKGMAATPRQGVRKGIIPKGKEHAKYGEN